MSRDRRPPGPMPGPGPGGHGPMGGGRTFERPRDTRRALVRLAKYVLPYKISLVFVLLLIVASTVLSLLPPYLLGVAIDRYLLPRNIMGFLGICLLILGIYVGNCLAQAGQGILVTKVAQRALSRIRKDLFDHLQMLSLSYFDKRPSGELMSRLTNDIDAISNALTLNAAQLISSLLTVTGILIAMFVINFWLALGTLLVVPLMVGVTFLIGRKTFEGFRDLQAQLGRLNGNMEESISGARVIQAFGQQQVVLANFDNSNFAVRDAGIKAMSFVMLMQPLMNLMSNMSIAAVAGLGGWLAFIGLASVGTIATFINYARNFTMPLRQLADLYNSLQTALAGAERVFEVIDEKPEITDKPGAYVLEKIEGEVVFDHVDFSYVPGVPVLKDVSLHAKPGQTTALVGPTGAGKTTMVNVLGRFYDIEEGAILIDGRDIRDVEKDSLRRQLGVVLQDVFLFSDTAMENIRYGRLDATDEECIAAAKLANADQFITRLPQGYKTMLSERGSNLSQGQRQLLSIARAVLANPSILVLDEATSSVDTRTEIRIQEALLRLMKGRTSFVIAHRLSTIRNADQLLVINDGQIIERGTHRSLLEKRGFYYNLYMSQFKGTDISVEPAAPSLTQTGKTEMPEQIKNL